MATTTKAGISLLLTTNCTGMHDMWLPVDGEQDCDNEAAVEMLVTCTNLMRLLRCFNNKLSLRQM